MKPGHTHPKTFTQFKHSVFTIKNKDELCCAQAIVTAKAKRMVTPAGILSKRDGQSRTM